MSSSRRWVENLYCLIIADNMIFIEYHAYLMPSKRKQFSKVYVRNTSTNLSNFCIPRKTADIGRHVSQLFSLVGNYQGQTYQHSDPKLLYYDVNDGTTPSGSSLLELCNCLYTNTCKKLSVILKR